VRNRRFLFLKIIGLALIGVVAIVLYADLQGMHQIFRITDSMISNAPDAQTRQHLVAEKKKRDREERRERIAIEGALAVDAFLFVWLLSSGLRRPRHVDPPLTSTVA
jgi:hypothetical protein